MVQVYLSEGTRQQTKREDANMKKTWKRVISLLLVVCMMTTFAATAAFDDEVFAETPAGEEAVDLFAADTERSEMPLYTEATADLSAADGTYTWVNHDRAIEYPRTQTTAWSDSEQSGYARRLSAPQADRSTGQIRSWTDWVTGCGRCPSTQSLGGHPTADRQHRRRGELHLRVQIGGATYGGVFGR